VVAHTLVRVEKSGAAQKAYNSRRAQCEEALTLMRADPEVRGKMGKPPETDPTYPDLLARLSVEELVEMAESVLPPTLHPRFRHVVTEGARVYAAEEAMKGGDPLTFGILMDASHESLRTDYEVSSPELDHLVDLARDAGAYGARLTGAGFGGCVVALVHANRVERVMKTLEEEYSRGSVHSGPLSDVLFVATAGPGASVEAIA
jgi:galactokinase